MSNNWLIKEGDVYWRARYEGTTMELEGGFAFKSRQIKDIRSSMGPKAFKRRVRLVPVSWVGYKGAV